MKVRKLYLQVRAFMMAFGQYVPVRMRPMTPPDDVVRLRCRLVAEEAFELLAACFPLVEWDTLQNEVMARINVARVRVDLPDLADACADLDYVVEGTRLSFGIRGEEIADAVHEANMAKVGGPVVNGKKLKPEGWKAPDIEGLLRAQGWAR